MCACEDQRAGGKDPWTVAEADGKKILEMPDGTVGYVVNEGSLVVASKDVTGKVKELIDGKGASVFDGPLKDVIARADTSKTIWIAGTIPEERVKGTPAKVRRTRRAASISAAGHHLRLDRLRQRRRRDEEEGERSSSSRA